ncbi:helix-turn-helix domain-containing protein [Bariatricus sp. HCP28S3_C2]|uniref:helix-turn-helix domain-containing protein n=1 Tax=unclassified Bariatricus TaxID=2677046 RepID=UPI003F8B61DB
MSNIQITENESGKKNAVAKGKQIGRPETTKDNLPDKFWKYYQMYKAGNINISEMARIMDCSRASVYKYIKIAEMECKRQILMRSDTKLPQPFASWSNSL